MGALRGSLTFTRFFVVGDVPDDLSSIALKRIRAQAFQPLVPDEDVSERHGWASLEDLFDTDLDHEKVFFNEYLVLSLRMDRWMIPGPLLKAHLKDAEAKVREKKGLDKLGRKAKADLKDMVVKRLRRQLVPVTRGADFVWNLQTNVVLFFSHADKAQELVIELFEKTFKLRLLVESPGTAADRRGLVGSEQKTFEALEPTSLASSATPSLAEMAS